MHFHLNTGLYDQRFYWSSWVIERDYILQSWLTLKLLSNEGGLINPSFTKGGGGVRVEPNPQRFFFDNFWKK